MKSSYSLLLVKTLVASALLVALGSFAPVHAADVPKAVLDAEAERVAVVEKVSPAVVAVFAAGGQGGGSGVLISADGYALSNFHVTRPCGDAMKCGLNDGKVYDAVIVGIDPVGDVALVKLLGREDFPHAELGDSDTVKVGDWSYAMGNPFLLATDFTPTVTYGIVSGVHRYQYPSGTILEYADCIQSDASINPGNSGGPLFDSKGKLIGINGRGSFEKRGRVNVGVGYAISINQIKNFMGHLKSGSIVDHATLGAQVSSNENGDVVVSNILESSDAFRRGLRYGDEIVSFAGRPIRTVNAFKNALGIFPKGWQVPLTYRRKGEKVDIFVRLKGVHRSSELAAKIGAKGEDEKEDKDEKDDKKKDDEKPKGESKKDDAKKDGETPKDNEKKEDAEKGKEPAKDDPLKKAQKDLPKMLPRQGKQAAPMPEHVKKLFEAKNGYANYYFNRLNQDRVWANFVARGDFTGAKGSWSLSGDDGANNEVQLSIAEKKVGLVLPSGDAEVEIADDLSQKLEPAGSGGLGTALYLWRRLLVGGPKAYGVVHYLGTAPVAGHEGLADVLVGTHANVECHFLFDAAKGKGHLLGIDLFAEDDSDPCEIRFSEFAEVEGRMLPHRMEVRQGDKPFGVYKLKEFKLEPKSEK